MYHIRKKRRGTCWWASWRTISRSAPAPGTVIDTLQKARTAPKDNAYANDYGDISLLKDFADRHALAMVVVHHIRKQGDSDVFYRVSGTTGLTGSADATFVLEAEIPGTACGGGGAAYSFSAGGLYGGAAGVVGDGHRAFDTDGGKRTPRPTSSQSC